MHYQPKQDLLNDRIILVTGASDGIGREAAMTYARYGATVILLGRNEEKLRQVASHINEETGRQPQWFILDLLTCTSEDCQQLAQRITVNYPRLDGVLHNAGLLGDVCPMSEQNPQVWQDVIQVNVNATFMLTQALLPLLLKSDAGSLVFTSSSVGRQGRANWGAYAASKFATEGMMQVLADEYQQRLRVNCINQQRVKEKVDARVAQAQDERGIIIVFTGNGKGKTTAAFGTATRAVGHGKKVGVVQFIKGTWPNGERNLLEPHGVEFQVMATGFTWDTQNRESDTAACREVWQHAKRMLADSSLDMVLLDELTYMVAYDYLPLEEVVQALNERPHQQTVIITGRGCHRDILELADTVSELRPIKHAFDAGVKAQIGIDY
ncbi:MAG: YciK family oxidoreductase [Escherichia coli]|nr:YciK family oxidoreductase [Escherichia coli]